MVGEKGGGVCNETERFIRISLRIVYRTGTLDIH